MKRTQNSDSKPHVKKQNLTSRTEVRRKSLKYLFLETHCIFVRQEIKQLRSAVVRKKEEKRFEETKEKIEKRPEVRNTSSQTYGRGGSFRRQKRER